MCLVVSMRVICGVHFVSRVFVSCGVRACVWWCVVYCSCDVVSMFVSCVVRLCVWCSCSCSVPVFGGVGVVVRWLLFLPMCDVMCCAWFSLCVLVCMLSLQLCVCVLHRISIVRPFILLHLFSNFRNNRRCRLCKFVYAVFGI